MPSDVSPAEAAAIIAAIEQHVTATEPKTTESTEMTRSWGFSGRLESLAGYTDRPPRQLPVGKWRALSRLER